MKRTLGASVEENTYWEFKTIAALNGEKVSEMLGKIISEFLDKAEMDITLNNAEAKASEEKVFKEKGATPDQMSYIGLLCNKTNEPLPKKQLSVSEADAMIKKLKKKLKEM